MTDYCENTYKIIKNDTIYYDVKELVNNLLDYLDTDPYLYERLHTLMSNSKSGIIRAYIDNVDKNYAVYKRLYDISDKDYIGSLKFKLYLSDIDKGYCSDIYTAMISIIEMTDNFIMLRVLVDDDNKKSESRHISKINKNMPCITISSKKSKDITNDILLYLEEVIRQDDIEYYTDTVQHMYYHSETLHNEPSESESYYFYFNLPDETISMANSVLSGVDDIYVTIHLDSAHSNITRPCKLSIDCIDGEGILVLEMTDTLLYKVPKNYKKKKCSITIVASEDTDYLGNNKYRDIVKANNLANAIEIINQTINKYSNKDSLAKYLSESVNYDYGADLVSERYYIYRKSLDELYSKYKDLINDNHFGVVINVGDKTVLRTCKIEINKEYGSDVELVICMTDTATNENDIDD